MHESVHLFDSQSGARDIHIPEWYVTRPATQALGLAYQDNPQLTRDFASRYGFMTVDGRAQPLQLGGLLSKSILGKKDREQGEQP